MSIKFNSQTGVFILTTKHTSYQMQTDRHGVLLHLYYGKKVEGELCYLIQSFDTGFSGNPYDAGRDRSYSLDTLPQEFPSFGVGDYRTSCIELVHSDGSRACDFRYSGHQIEAGAKKVTGMPALYDLGGEAQTLCILLEDRVSGVKLSLSYTVFEEKDVIARTATIINESKDTLILEKMLSACLDLPYGDWELLHFEGRHAMERIAERTPLIHGSQRIGSKRGTSSHQHNPTMILCSPNADEDHGSCYGFALVYSSNFVAEAEVDQRAQTRAVIGIHPEQFNFVLETGQEFNAPQVIMSYSADGFGELSHINHRILRHNMCRGLYQLSSRPILLNSWEATYFDCRKENILSLAKEAVNLGIEMLVLDDGWFGKRDSDNAGLGDWFVNKKKMGGSMKDLVEEVNQMGLKFGIWMEPEMVSEDSELFRTHPDWALTIPGRKPCLSREQLVLDLSREEVRNYLFDSISALLNGANIEYVKWDMNRSMCDVYSSAKDWAHQGEIYHRCMLGVYDLMERIVTAFPHVLLENCSGGGGRFDPAMLYYSPQIWCSDDTDAIERLEIQYGTSFFYPVSSVGAHVSSSPNHQTGRSTPLATRAVVAMAGTFGYELDLGQLSDQEKEMVKQQIIEFKRYSRLIHEGKYYRLLTPNSKEKVTAWQIVSQDKKCALVSLVCTHVRANVPVVWIKLKGLDKTMNYKIEGYTEIFGGDALMYGGISVPIMQGDYPSRQLYLTKV